MTVIHLFGVCGILILLASTNLYTMFGISSLLSAYSVASNALARIFNFSTEVEHSDSKKNIICILNHHDIFDLLKTGEAWAIELREFMARKQCSSKIEGSI